MKNSWNYNVRYLRVGTFIYIFQLYVVKVKINGAQK